MPPERAPEPFTEGPEPTLEALLPLDIGIRQLASFFGTTEAVITETLKPQATRRYTEGTTTQLILSNLRRDPTGVGLRVEACNKDNVTLGAGTIAYLHDEQTLVAAPTSARM